MYLVIGPAAMGIFSFIGCLTHIDLNKIEEVSGSSAGAILGLFICLGKTVEEIKEFCLNVNLTELSKMSISTFLSSFGLISHDPIKKEFRDFCGGNPTFRELSKKLHVTCFCVNKCETQYFSVDAHPDMHVIDAVCMSMSVPFLFETCKYKNFTYLDGGTYESVPTLAFINKNPKDILVIRLAYHKKHLSEIKTIKDFINSMIHIAVNNRIYEKSGYKEIQVDIGHINIFDFTMSYEEKLKLYLLGQHIGLNHFASDK